MEIKIEAIDRSQTNQETYIELVLHRGALGQVRGRQGHYHGDEEKVPGSRHFSMLADLLS
jgi:hypothetical protein